MVCGLWFVVCGLWFRVCGLGFVVCGLWFRVCGLWFVVCGLQSRTCYTEALAPQRLVKSNKIAESEAKGGWVTYA